MTFINIPKVVCLSLIQLSFANPVQQANNGCQHPCLSEGICKAMQFSDNCYYVFTNTMTTWQESGALCESHNMKMVQLLQNVKSNELKRKVQEILKDFESGSFVWLGGKARDLWDWTFLNGIGVNETSANLPSSSEDGQQLYLCGVILGDLTVDRDDCRNTHPFICRFDDWQNMPNFYISEARSNWYEARSKCKDLNGDLLYLKSGESLRFLNRKLQPFKDQKIFIGLTTRLWEWKDDQEIVHYNWQDKEPNKLSEKCIVMYPSTAQWNDMDCNAKLFAFCQQAIQPNADSVTDTKTQNQPEDGNNSGYVAAIVILTIIAMLALVALAFFIFRTRRLENDKSEHIMLPQQDPTESTVWPFSVELHDTGPYCKIFLHMPGMQLSDDKKPKNVVVTNNNNKDIFKKRSAAIFVEVAENPDKEVKYHYKATFQKEIDPDASMVTFQPEYIVLRIKKVEINHSWKQYGYNPQPSSTERPLS